ncbi:hypothetical protein B5P44_00535 [Mycobacterium sp. CBMA 213]|uniref:Uncharacterized protein n=1 Tax=Mycolicibacterium sp. CBMA 213 TaxID=1968788 RepID=A0A343VR90_9MYCO|nr:MULTISPECIES: hypothetical protein [unclassified Mycolicibacterium]AVN58414.1 hypothetical protein B5P44_p00119 [Mycolicibacterium sp. CBMA 213]MUL61072.1 hypothetical protein [Mycolicibacterium sp. CBMA 335]MUM03310.1 hypothetical protein [Mycolicibacterium sp. CBMA 213]
MSDLTGLQQSLDLYGAAVYWRYVFCAENEPAALATKLRERAVAAGASHNQLFDAEQHVRECVLTKRKPLMAGHSFPYFRNEATR